MITLLKFLFLLLVVLFAQSVESIIEKPQFGTTVENTVEAEAGDNVINAGITKSNGIDSMKDEIISGESSTADSEGTFSQSNGETFEYPELRRSIDLQVNPCDNFYEFVCAGFRRDNVIPDHQRSISQQDFLIERIEDELNEIFDDRELMKEIAPYDRLMYHIYDTCMNDTGRHLERSIGLIEKLRVRRKSRQDITDWMISSYPTTGLYDIGIIPHLRQPNKKLFFILPYSTYLTDKLYLEESQSATVTAYREYMHGVLAILAEDNKAAANRSANSLLPFSLEPDDIKKRVDAMLDFETKVAKMNIVSKDDDFFSFPIYVTVANFQRDVISSVDWVKFFGALMPEQVLNDLAIANKTIGELEIVVADFILMLKYEKLVRNLSAEEIEYILDWQMIKPLVEHLDDRFVNIYYKFKRVLVGRKTAPPKKDSCRESARLEVQNGFRRIYLRKYYNQTAVEPIIRGINANIVAAFRQMLQNNSWMDNVTRTYAIKKLSMMKHFIGVPDHVDDKVMELSCETLDVELLLNLTYPETKAFLSRWSKRQRFCWLLRETPASFDATTINAWYMPRRNAVAVSSGLLRGAYLDTNHSAALNYGGIGAVIAHEMIHGFDDYGRTFDASGIIRDWWEKKATRNFIDRKRCFIEQYASVNLTNTTLNIDGERTQSENIADNSGLRAAFLAFEAYLSQTSEQKQPRLLGFERFDARQQFFISFAFSKCSSERPEYQTYTLLADEHSPDDVRVNIPLANLEEFARAFNCPVDSPMNPAKKCVIW